MASSPGIGIAFSIALVVIRLILAFTRKGKAEHVPVGELDAATRRLLATPAFDARAESMALSLSADAGSVILFDVDGDVLFDGVSLALPPAVARTEEPGGYREAVAIDLGRAVAITRVCPGRHVVGLRVGGVMKAEVPLMIHPKEVRALRLPSEGTVAEDVGSAETDQARRALQDFRLRSCDYPDVVLPNVVSVVSIELRVKRTLSLFAKTAALVDVGRGVEDPEVRRAAQEMGSDLVAAGLSRPRYEVLVSGFGNVIWKTRSAAAPDALQRAVIVTKLALAVLPDEPVLLALLGETEKALGNTSEAKSLLERARARGDALGPTSFDASWRARVEAALAQRVPTP